jgi:hypothetical protein
MRADSGQQGSFSLTNYRLSIRRKNSQSNRTASFRVPRLVRLLLRTRAQPLVDPVPASKKRSLRQQFTHTR